MYFEGNKIIYYTVVHNGWKLNSKKNFIYAAYHKSFFIKKKTSMQDIFNK